MKILKTVKGISEVISGLKGAGNHINFVPTMGALHDGHIRLIENAKNPDSISVCSIFVNPTQFNDPADLKRYPVSIEEDIDKLEKAGCDILFLPSVAEIYPPDFKEIHYDLGNLENILEGKFRANHFQGVCMVVHRLLDIVRPDKIFMGQKDYQQCAVIKKLISMFSIKTEFVEVPTIRKKDGLALSSRNVLLTDEEKLIAPSIFKQLQLFKNNIRNGKTKDLKNEFVNNLKSKGIETEYIELADSETLEIKYDFDNQKSVLLFAGYLGKVRLIDNLIIE